MAGPPEDIAHAQPAPPAVQNPQAQLSGTTQLRCPNCNRLSSWPTAFVQANSGQTVNCQLCNLPMTLP